MKTATLIAAFFSLSLSASFGGGCGSSRVTHNEKPRVTHYEKPRVTHYEKPRVTHYEKTRVTHHYDHENHYEVGSSLPARLAIAPTSYGYGSNVHTIRNAAASASSIMMLGKVQYAHGASGLGYNANEEIGAILSRSGGQMVPGSMIVVLGYADRTGRTEINLRLSENRAANVKNQIDQINWAHRLGIHTASVAMGEKVELCSQEFGHNRVAEIWLLNFARPLAQVVSVVAPPAINTQFVQPHVATPVAVTQPQAIATPNQLVPAPLQQQVMVQPQPVVNPLQQLASFLEHNVMLSPNADPNEFARQLSLLKNFGNVGTN